MKLKRATWKLRTEALRRYRERHKGSLDQAEGEMDNLLKSKIGRASKTPVDKYVSADRDFNNTSMLGKQLSIKNINDNPPPYTAQAAEIEKQTVPSKHQLNVMGDTEHDTGMPVRISGDKVLMKSEKTSPVPQHSESSTGAVIADSSSVDGESYDEYASVFDDELVFDGGCLDYETSSVSVDIVTERVMSEESLTDDDDDEPEKIASCYCDDAQAVANGNLTLTLNTVVVSVNSDDESTLSVNAEHCIVKPLEEKLPQGKQGELPGAQKLGSNNNKLKIDIRLPVVRNNTTCSSSDADVLIDKHSYEDTENIRLVQLDKGEATETDCVAADESLEQHQEIIVERESPLHSKEAASQSGVISGRDSVSLDEHSISSSSCDDTDWHLASLFENTSYDSGSATPVNVGRTSESRILSVTSSDWRVRSSLFSGSAPSSAGSEEKSNGTLRFPLSRGCSACGSECRPRSGNFQESAAEDGEERKSVIVPSPVQHFSSSHCSSDWHLASIFYEESACGTEAGGRESTARNLSSRESSEESCSEWHIGSLLFCSSDLSSRQLSGDSHA